jgi:hypothetical protein
MLFWHNTCSYKLNFSHQLENVHQHEDMNNSQLLARASQIMKNKLPFFLFLLLFVPTISSGTEIHTMDLEFSFTAPDDPARQLIGYRLYKEGKQVCDTNNPTTTLNSSNSAHPINIEIGEISIDQNWATVPFKNTFSLPVVIAGPPTANDAAQVLVRIRNISKTGFEIRLQEKDSPNGEHIPETISYMVIEKGTYTLDNGSKLEAGNFTGSNSYEQISLQLLYDFPPVILTQVITENGPDSVSGRIRNINQYSFEFKQQGIQETTDAPIPETISETISETIGYIAWEPGKGEVSGLAYEIGTTAKRVTRNWFDLNFESKFQDLPFFIAAMQSYAGSDITTVRIQNLSQTTIQIKTEKGESEDSHAWQNEEAVGYFTIGAVAD